MSKEINEIKLLIHLDDQKIPEKLEWSTGQDEENQPEIKAFLLSMFDAETMDTLKIDLWTKNFQVMEMDRFIYQTLRAMADTYHKATKNDSLANDMQNFVRYFGEKTGIITPEQS